ncbi:hypothetical protein, partial [Pedobacter suwonensis]|uniref:hypothetical protein n=1 Tax=Pedobacter suwonensis TaxID=332999 RepID=UPI00381961AA
GQYFILSVCRAPTFVPKPDSSGSLRFFIGAIAHGGTASRQEPQTYRFRILKQNYFFIWGARPVQITKFRPVFRFYASLPLTSLMQGNRLNRG